MVQNLHYTEFNTIHMCLLTIMRLFHFILLAYFSSLQAAKKAYNIIKKHAAVSVCVTLNTPPTPTPTPNSISSLLIINKLYISLIALEPNPMQYF
jgi:hypothetical protein